ncbi:Hypothetical protein ACA1_367000 [Acanthamoeba castellanii str. Neff]|uniref:Spermatogenesis-associated protein 20-like TRX domain-containing protein n=1 Tax=Acanthamoeba castellanii (strain ATCC 30010 / Neff) TaxID=1257118 RepID=L8GM78_ACACF|nr:Hypothetical protein ACA1_367000 [Acanthamoeba castellanii str. Neff]ELR14077.1 Hypothetical protein ACA1_367000 [Acanthamoeba castellanii str. Neff]
MSRLSIDQAVEYEALREDIATEKQTLRNYEIREERNKQALGYLAKPDAESKVWYCAGDFFIHLPKQKAEGLVQRDRDNAACEAEATHERIKSKTVELQQLAKRPSSVEYEALREDIATEKQTLRNYEIREERNKQALGYLAKPDAESKVWYCAGDFFIHLPKQKAEGLVQRDRDNAACEAEATHERIKSKTVELQQLAKYTGGGPHLSTAPTTPAAVPPQRKENRLAAEKSPYLLQHKHNPVDWYAWGEEAFAKAKRENKPIFLEKISRLLNDNFVSIKVDREERPDVDRLYMTYVTATTGHGGWPLSVFLTPDLKPLVGGTYFPPTSKYGRPGFDTLIHNVDKVWREKQDQLKAEADNTAHALQEYMTVAGKEVEGIDDDSIEIAYDAALKSLAESYDEEHGGFTRAPKFPRLATLNFLFRVYGHRKEGLELNEKATKAMDMALVTLTKMARGGIYDHIGNWLVPHFEKMLYDQSQLTMAYLSAYQITDEPVFADVAEDVLEYVTTKITSPEGAFYSAEDADSLVSPDSDEKVEGAFYVWEYDEVIKALGEQDGKIFAHRYGVLPEGNVPAPADIQGELKHKNVLAEKLTAEETALEFGFKVDYVDKLTMESKAKLKHERDKRPRPHLDDKIITSWNGLMISAYARASEVLGDKRYAESASKCAQFIRDQLYDDQEAILWARQRGYFNTVKDDPSLLARVRDDQDGAEPSSNSISAMNLVRLWHMTGSDDWYKKAEATFSSCKGPIITPLRLTVCPAKDAPLMVPQMLCSLDFSRATAKQIVIAGDPNAEDTAALLKEVRSQFIPNRVLLYADGREGQDFLSSYRALIKDMKPIDGAATAYVCENFTCKLPTNKPEKLRDALAS